MFVLYFYSKYNNIEYNKEIITTLFTVLIKNINSYHYKLCV